jgi:hypothetical protein
MRHTLTIDRVGAHSPAVEDGVDAAVPVDAKNAPTSDLENCKDRGFPQRPHRLFFSGKKNPKNERQNRSCKCANLTVSTEGFTPKRCARTCVNNEPGLYLAAA